MRHPFDFEDFEAYEKTWVNGNTFSVAEKPVAVEPVIDGDKQVGGVYGGTEGWETFAEWYLRMNLKASEGLMDGFIVRDNLRRVFVGFVKDWKWMEVLHGVSTFEYLTIMWVESVLESVSGQVKKIRERLKTQNEEVGPVIRRTRSKKGLPARLVVDREDRTEEVRVGNIKVLSPVAVDIYGWDRVFNKRWEDGEIPEFYCSGYMRKIHLCA